MWVVSRAQVESLLFGKQEGGKKEGEEGGEGQRKLGLAVDVGAGDGGITDICSSLFSRVVTTEVCLYVCMYVCMYVYVCVSMYVCVLVCMCVLVCV